ncbi:MAG TPA: hypothetical protein VHD63_08665, partial [Ktedonobacteraceae bacterium]|nr:hypothetical protein [Ktedonobacteraceae bacterium]
MDIRTLLQMYFADAAAQQAAQSRIQRRSANVNQLRVITQHFIAGETGLTAFRDEIEATLRKKGGDDWGATGPGFLMGFNQLVKHHHDATHDMENYVRRLLAELHPDNLGIRIEDLYAFLLSERARLRREGKGNVAMAAG